MAMRLTCVALGAHTCVRCARRQGGVASATVNLLAQTAEVMFDSGRVAVDQLRDLIEDAGYEATLQPQVRAWHGWWPHAHCLRRL